MNVRAEVTVRGFVQGVGYRRFAQLRAVERELTGTVRNMDDGSVFIEVEGDEPVVKSYVEDLRRGPSFSRVTDVTIQWQPYTGRYRQFTVRF